MEKLKEPIDFDVTYVTAFLDIGRGNWKEFNRSLDTYYDAFVEHLVVFSNVIRSKKIDSASSFRYNFMIFIDSKLQQRLLSTLKEMKEIHSLIKNGNIKFVFINEAWMENYSLMWKKLPNERVIINSEEYKATFSMRLKYPENSDPKYSLINHSKVDFIGMAMEQFKDCDRFCWIDFGYFINKNTPRPKTLIDVSKLPKGKIVYSTINPPTELDRCTFYTAHFSPERIGGFFFYGDRQVLNKYIQMYHEIHDKFQRMGLVDDDQHIALRCFFDNPMMFQLYNLGWHQALNYFQVELA